MSEGRPARPRVGVLTTSYPRHAGDPAGLFVHGLCEQLVRAGARLEVLAAADHGATDATIGDEVVDTGARQGDLVVHRVRYAPPRWQTLFYTGGAPEALEARRSAWVQAGLFQAAQLLAAARRAHRWDALVSHWLLPSALSGALGDLLAAGPRPRPHLAIAHSGDVSLADRLGLLGPLFSLLARRPVQLAFASGELRRRALAGVPPSATAARALVSRALVTPMGVDTAEIPGPEQAAALRRATRQRLELDGVTTVGLVLGRLSPVKGVDVAVEATLAMSGRPFALLVAGDGPERSALEASAGQGGGRVRLLGPVAPAERWALLCAADLLLVPSRRLDGWGAGGRTEGAPTVVTEAGLVGLPTVASRVGGLSDLVDDAASGLLVPPGDAAALAAAVARLCDDPSLRERLGATARQRAAARAWPAAAAPLLAALGLAP